MYYDQLKKKDQNYACGPYSFLNVIKFDFGLEFPEDIIVKGLIYLEKIEARFRKWGMYANVGFPAIIKYFEFKTGFKLKIVKGTINTLGTKTGYVLGFKRANSLYLGYTKDGEFDKMEMLKLKDMKAGGHFHYYKRGTILETLGGYSYKVTKDDLKYARDIDLYYNSTRSFIANDDRTRNAQKKLISMAKKRNKLISRSEFRKIDFK